MSGWSAVPLYYLVRFRNGEDYKEVEDPEGDVPVIGSGGPFTTACTHIYDGESVLFGRKGTIDKPRHETGRFWTVDTMFYTVLGPRVYGRWLYYWATTVPYKLYSTSTALPSMTSAVLGRLRVSLPPLAEQRVMAEYLDRETAKIDALMEKQSMLIDRLRERRATVISRSVIGSGEWDTPRGGAAVRLDSQLASLPPGWERVRLSRLVSEPVTAGVDYSAAPFDPENHLRYLRTTDIAGLHSLIPSEVAVGITEAQAGSALVRRGDLLLTRSGSLGTSYLHDSGDVMAYAGYLVRARFREDLCNDRFMAWWSLSDDHLDQISLGATRSTIDNFSASKFAALRVPLPPLAQQREIADHLDRETAKIDTLISKAERFIELARERRSALITAAVTGQIDVTEGAT